MFNQFNFKFKILIYPNKLNQKLLINCYIDDPKSNSKIINL